LCPQVRTARSPNRAATNYLHDTTPRQTLPHKTSHHTRSDRGSRQGASAPLRKRRFRRYTSPPEMAGERVKLQVQARESRGSAASRRLREDGLIPGVLYGSGDEAHPFCIEERSLRKALTGDHGLHAILDVVLEGQQKA